jgi:hypothetical protein
MSRCTLTHGANDLGVTAEYVHHVVRHRLLGLLAQVGATARKTDGRRSGPTKASGPSGKDRVLIQLATRFGIDLVASTKWVMAANDGVTRPADDDIWTGYLHNGMKRG